MLSLLRPVIAGAVVVVIVLLAFKFHVVPQTTCRGVPPYGQHDYSCTFTLPGR